MTKFNEIGFLASELEGWTAQVRDEFKLKFNLADRINRLGMKMLFDLPVENMSEAHILGNLCFGRALQSFQCALLPAERGALADARTLVRSCVESVVMLSALKIDSDLPARLVEDHDAHRLSFVNAFLDRDNQVDILNSEQVLNYQSMKAEILAKYPNRKPRDVKLAELAVKGGVLDLYNIAYRQASGDGAHPTVLALDRHVSKDASGNMAGFKFHPEKSDLNETLYLACGAMLQAAGLVADWLGLEKHRAELTDCIQEFAQQNPLAA